VKHESATISIKYNHRRVLKDISEALEQLPSSKDISEAHRVFQQITIIVCPPQKVCPANNDCGKLKSKQRK
jgi:hypothetical protein